MRLRLRSNRERIALAVDEAADRLAGAYPAPVFSGGVLAIPGYPEVVDALADCLSEAGLYDVEFRVKDFLRWRS